MAMFGFGNYPPDPAPGDSSGMGGGVTAGGFGFGSPGGSYGANASGLMFGGQQNPDTLFGANGATGQMFGGQSAAPLLNNQFGFATGNLGFGQQSAFDKYMPYALAAAGAGLGYLASRHGGQQMVGGDPVSHFAYGNPSVKFAPPPSQLSYMHI